MAVAAQPSSQPKGKGAVPVLNMRRERSEDDDSEDSETSESSDSDMEESAIIGRKYVAYTLCSGLI